MSNDRFKRILQDCGLRATKARLATLSCLTKQSEPLTTSQICQAMAAQAAVDPVSVYRSIEALEAKGLIHQVLPSRGYILCNHLDCPSQVHVILTCNKCNKTREVDIPRELVASASWFIAKNFSFDADHHGFQWRGACQECSS